ncbi:MAG: trypsin-like peptidase domain-containing protein [Planctomycetota bacterium]|nr:trypsin-like peptidase domain-containing protein [Planctomycetota bacterium]
MLSLFLALTAPLSTPRTEDETELYRRRVTPIVEVAREASPAVVFIKTENVQVVRDFWGRVFQQDGGGAGSGVVIHKDGFIITNYHVIDGAKKLSVTFDAQYDATTYTAEVVSFVKQEDLALLKIVGEREFPTIPLGTSKDLMLGETVIAIGNPEGQVHSVSDGIISGLHRNVTIPTAFGTLKFDDLIQTNASINPGNSGGPLLNINGELIGINNAMNREAQGIGFAIPVDHVKRVLEERMLAPDSAPTWLGFDVIGEDHLQIGTVVPGGPAESAGLRAGDCIVAVGGTTVVNHDSYKLARAGLSPNREVELKVERAGQERVVRLSPWNRFDGVLYEHLGMKVKTVVPPHNNYTSYIVITEVRPGGPAAELGLQVNDAIDAVRPLSGARARPLRVPSRELFASLVTELDPGMKLQVDVYRDVDQNGRFEEEELHRGTLTLR